VKARATVARWLFVVGVFSFGWHTFLCAANQGLLSAFTEATAAATRECERDAWSRRSKGNEILCALLYLSGVLVTTRSLYHYWRSKTDPALPASTPKKDPTAPGRLSLLTDIGSVGLEYAFHICGDALSFDQCKKALLLMSLTNLAQGNFLKARYYFKKRNNLLALGERANPAEINERIHLQPFSETSVAGGRCFCLNEVTNGGPLHSFCSNDARHVFHESCLRTWIITCLLENRIPTCPLCSSGELSYQIVSADYEADRTLLKRFLGALLFVPNQLFSGMQAAGRWRRWILDVDKAISYHPAPSDPTVIGVGLNQPFPSRGRGQR